MTLSEFKTWSLKDLEKKLTPDQRTIVMKAFQFQIDDAKAQLEKVSQGNHETEEDLKKIMPQYGAKPEDYETIKIELKSLMDELTGNNSTQKNSNPLHKRIY